MAVDHRSAAEYLDRLILEHGAEALLAQLLPKLHPHPPRVPGGTGVDPDDLDRRWARLPARQARSVLVDATVAAEAARYAHNVENFVGTVRVPVGVAGPLRVNGIHAQGDYYVPLATTEAALVASYHRGACLLTEAGGASAVTTYEGVMRSPGFAFADLHEAVRFVSWVVGSLETLREVAHATTRYGRLRDLRVNLEGNHVYLIFDYTTGDAAGQNMVTIATQAVCDHILAHTPVAPRYAFVEANHSGDKKASAQAFLGGRGRSVTCEARLPAALVEKFLHVRPDRMERYWRMSAMGGVLSGTIGVQGHYANGLAAIFLATGQDVACVAESAVGVTRFEVEPDGALYASVTLPNLVVGTVGGGTGLPTQRACLELLSLAGAGHAGAFAEVCAAVALAGELSIVGALVAGDFTRAHDKLARGSTSAGAHVGAL